MSKTSLAWIVCHRHWAQTPITMASATNRSVLGGAGSARVSGFVEEQFGEVEQNVRLGFK